jgi:hypothetical protein
MAIVRVIAGDQAKWDRELASVPKVGNYYESNALVALQERQSRAGYLPAKLIKSNFGWSIRYASGLQDFGVLLAPRGRMTLAEVIAWGKQWVAASPNRVLLVSKSEITPELEPFLQPEIAA